jgi:hypothetical protein
MQLSSLVYLTLISSLLTHCADNDDEKKLNKEKQQLAQENKNLQDALAANSTQSLAELSKKEDELARQTDQLTRKANELKDEQDKNQATIQGLEQQINVKNAAAATLEKAIAIEKETVAKANENIRVAGVEAKTLKDERETLKNELLKKEELLLSATTTEARIKLEIKDIEGKLSEKEAKIKDLDRSLQEMTANSNDDKLKNLTIELEKEKSERNAIETELGNFRNSMALTLNPFWGLYYSPSTLSLAGTECRIFAYADEKGNFTQAFVCDDGKMQWSNSRIQTFDAVIDTSLDGNYGLNMKVSEPTLSSCVNGQQSGLSIGRAYTFSREATFGGAIFSAKASIDYEGAKVVLDNASIKFKSNECEDLVARYNNQANGFSKDEMAILKNAVLVCDAVAGKEVKAGCFTSNDTFN